MRILCIDPGTKNIGIALSDPTGTLAKPLTIIQHISRTVDAVSIAALATDKHAELIIIGQALDQNGNATFSGRSATRLAAAIRRQTDIPVVLWDESFSTKVAQSIKREKYHSEQNKHMDDVAAAIILQTYLDSQQQG